MNKKYKVSPEYIRLFLGLLHEGIDSKLEDLSGLNLVNRDSVKRLVKEYLYPEYQNFTISTQFRIKESLRFGLNFWTEERLYDQFPSTDAAFEIPQQMTAKELYKQIWDDMFNNETYHLDIDRDGILSIGSNVDWGITKIPTITNDFTKYKLKNANLIKNTIVAKNNASITSGRYQIPDYKNVIGVYIKINDVLVDTLKNFDITLGSGTEWQDVELTADQPVKE